MRMNQRPHNLASGCNKSLSSASSSDNSTSSILNKALMSYKTVTSTAATSSFIPLVINHSTTSSATKGTPPSSACHDKIENWNEAQYILSNLPPPSILTSIIASNSGKTKTLLEQHQKQSQQQQHTSNQQLAVALTSTTITANSLNKSSSRTTNITKNVSKSSNAILLKQQLEASVSDKTTKIDPKAGTISKHNTNCSVVQTATGFVTARLVDLGKRLLEAARDGQTENVRHLVVDSGAPFTSDWLGTTALHLAAQNGYHEITEILLKGGVNREARTKLERTALHAAAQGGWLKVVELLISHGSEVNSRDMLKMTPLHWAVEREHVGVAERLLLAGADIHLTSKFQLSPLDLAQKSPNFKIQQLFKEWLTKNESLGLYGQFTGSFYEFHDMVDADVDCLLPAVEGEDSCSPHHHNHHYHPKNNRTPTILSLGSEPCIDLVELEWNNMKLESFLTTTVGATLASDEDDCDEGPEPKVEYLMKVVEELQKENQQLRQRVELLATTTTKRR